MGGSLGTFEKHKSEDNLKIIVLFDVRLYLFLIDCN